jgi:acyl carrier protein phosphodiesterase
MNSFGGLTRRAKYLEDSHPAFELFLQHYEKLQSLYADFFPDVKAFASSQFHTLIMH